MLMVEVRVLLLKYNSPVTNVPVEDLLQCYFKFWLAGYGGYDDYNGYNDGYGFGSDRFGRGKDS